MKNRMRQALSDKGIRQTFEEELLVGEATDTLAALVESLGIPQKELARRLGVTEGRVSQILSGGENLTLRSLATLGWALGVRFELNPSAMSDRLGTPAQGDPPSPAWLERLRPTARMTFAHVSLPPAGRLRRPTHLRVVKSGHIEAA